MKIVEKKYNRKDDSFYSRRRLIILTRVFIKQEKVICGECPDTFLFDHKMEKVSWIDNFLLDLL